MRINNNVMALNAHRQLGINQTNSSKSMERLSSGLRINRAGDDAAGLAISEKMRGQIRGLKQAMRNAQDGISLIQTAEGALNETHAILQRMRELAVQSATDTNTEVDRGEIQKEIDELAAEISRIADTTEFNTQNLLGGSFKGTFHIGANEGQDITLGINNMGANALRVEGGAGGLVVGESTGATTAANLNIANFAVEAGAEYTVVKLAEDKVVDGKTVSYGLQGSDGKLYGVITEDGNTAYLATAAGGAHENVDDLTFDETNTVGFDTGISVTSGTVTVEVGADPADTAISLKADSAVAAYSGDSRIASGTYTVVNDSHAFVATGQGGLVDSNGTLVAVTSTNFATGDFKDLSGNALFTAAGLSAGDEYTVKGEGGIDVSSQNAASAAITTLNKAIETVSAERSKLGAYQNRLEHTIANLGTSAENLQAAESRIRDLDMAEEIMAFTKNSILQQAATAMLAQANMAPQSVLQLLG